MTAPRNARRRAPATLVVLTLLLLGCKEQVNEFVPPPPPTVTVANPVEEEITTWVEFTGRTEATEFVEIRARVQGFLEVVHFEDGDVVEKGALLFEIEEEPFVAARNAAAAELERLKASADLANATLERTKKAAEAQAASEIEVLIAEAERDEAEAAVKSGQAALDQAELDLGYTKIHAPIGGRLSRTMVDPGNLVGAGDSTLLTTIVADELIYTYFNIDERSLLEFLRNRPRGTRREGGERPTVELILADGDPYEQSGVIDFASNIADPNTGTVEVRAIFPNEEGVLYPGLFARVRVPRDTSDRITIPDIAIQRDQAGSHVLIVRDDGTVERRAVAPGQRVGTRLIILEGLATDDSVIVNGIQRARPGLKVNAETESDADSTPPPADPRGDSEADG